ncbi:MAG: L-glutamine:2-deoxy-scyllo-inosose aminotransferase [Candidatus Hydrogenedentes bacterium ADurb.Bin179]|nr:MAG: L-glutamine:2-deoxy-scyllo-inosose aminotransferase [Candidatus Hydrogenedentes bacterium ADurb.Bin179]
MKDQLAIHGGKPVTTEIFPKPWLGPAAIGEEEVAAVAAAVRSQKLFRFLDPEHSKCAELERLFAAMTGRQYALALGGGTAALICGLAGLGIGEGDEVIVPGFTYIASASAVLICGAVPVIAEINASLTLDPEDVERKITSRTRAIMPVHMRGIPCDMTALMEVAKCHNLLVIEDCAQACGGSYQGKRLGSFGDAGCFSLQQHKVITAGEGGVLVTNRPEVYERAAIRHDSAMRFWNPENASADPFPGENFRMNEMEGALGCVQFGRMEGILARTRALRRRIYEGIAGVEGIAISPSPDPEGDLGITVVLQLPDYDRARQFGLALKAEGIPAGGTYDKVIADRHVYCYWEYVMNKGSMDRHGRPWTSPLHDQTRQYHPDMCPKTLEILGRTIVISLAQTFEDRHAEWVIQGIRKVAGNLI